MADRQGDLLTQSEAEVPPATRDRRPPEADPSARIERARAMVRRFTTNDYGVDDFLRDKRAEAARD